MDSTRTPTTSEGLLREAASPGSPRREEFARLYSAVVRRYVECASRGAMAPDDRDDVAQEIMASVMRALPGFNLDPSRGRFRGYLRASVSRALSHFSRHRLSEASEMAAIASSGRPPFGAIDRSDKIRCAIWARALARVRNSGRFEPNSLAMFERFFVEGRPAAEVAAEFKTNANAVYQCKNRIAAAIRSDLVALGHGRSSAEDLLEALVAADSEGR